MLSPEVRAELAKAERSMTVPEGTALIQQGVPPENLVIINSGKVAVSLNCMRGAGFARLLGAWQSFWNACPGLRRIAGNQRYLCRAVFDHGCATRYFSVLLQSHPAIYFGVAKVLSSDLKIADRILRNNSRRFLCGDRSRTAKTRLSVSSMEGSRSAEYISLPLHS